jgi:hypothetical protein
MRLELAERLRCPATHVPTPMVVVATRVAGRELLEGVVGCPMCRLEGRVTEGTVRFAEPLGIVLSGGAPPGADDEPDEDAIDRAAALLGLGEPGGAVLLAGRYATLAAVLRERFEVATAVIETRAAIPFGDATFRAAALDLGPVPLDAAPRTVVPGGRIVAPSSADVPAGLRELARDAADWVAEREATSGVVTLGRAGPPRTASR